MHARSLTRRAATTALAATLTVLATACSSSDDHAEDARAEPVDTGSTEPPSRIDRESTDASSDLEREVTETLSELDAETRDGDTVVTLPDRVLFPFGQYELLPDATQVLDNLVEAIDYFADAPVHVNGHTDAVDSDATNQTLSEQRAQAVVGYFTDAGVDPSRLDARGFGETQPVAPNTHDDGTDDPQGRAQNRRVEIIIEDIDLAALDPDS